MHWRDSWRSFNNLISQVNARFMNLLLLTPDHISEGRATISDPRRLKHIAEHLKLCVGDRIKVGIKDGLKGTAQVISVSEREIVLDDLQLTEPPPPMPSIRRMWGSWSSKAMFSEAFRLALIEASAEPPRTVKSSPDRITGRSSISATPSEAVALEETQVCAIPFAQLMRMSQRVGHLQTYVQRLLAREVVREAFPQAALAWRTLGISAVSLALD